MKKLLITLLLTLNAFASLSMDDIQAMHQAGVSISFDVEKNGEKVSANLMPNKAMEAVYIDFNGANLYAIPDWLPKMTKLVRLDLNNAQINLRELSKLSTLSDLKILELSNNPLFENSSGISLTAFLQNFSLQKLYLANVGGSSSDFANIGELSSLRDLNLSGNRISSVDELKFSNLSYLKYLDLSNNSIEEISSRDIPKSLVKLNLASNGLKSFAFGGDLPSLEVLDLSKNSSVSVDKKFGGILFLKQIKQVKVNSSIRLPQGLSDKLNTLNSEYTVINGLMYQKHQFEKEYTWEEAKDYCSNLTLAGYNDWRLPTIDELEKVVTDCGGIAVKFQDNYEQLWGKNRANTSYQKCYKSKGFSSYYYWSSTTSVDYSSVAWIVGFSNGYVYSYVKGTSNYVRCVRAGE